MAETKNQMFNWDKRCVDFCSESLNIDNYFIFTHLIVPKNYLTFETIEIKIRKRKS